MVLMMKLRQMGAVGGDGSQLRSRLERVRRPSRQAATRCTAGVWRLEDAAHGGLARHSFDHSLLPLHPIWRNFIINTIILAVLFRLSISPSPFRADSLWSFAHAPGCCLAALSTGLRFPLGCPECAGAIERLNSFCGCRAPHASPSPIQSKTNAHRCRRAYFMAKSPGLSAERAHRMINAKCNAGASCRRRRRHQQRLRLPRLCRALRLVARATGRRRRRGRFRRRLLITAGPARVGEIIFLGGVMGIEIGKLPKSTSA